MNQRDKYIINELRKEEAWRMFRIMSEFIEGFDELAGLTPAVTVYGSARVLSDDPMFKLAEDLGRRLALAGYAVITGGGPGIMEAANKGAYEAGGTSVGLTIATVTVGAALRVTENGKSAALRRPKAAPVLRTCVRSTRPGTTVTLSCRASVARTSALVA